MTAGAWNWLLAIVGTVASTTGLVFSWMAWRQAIGARQAAEEASRAVRLREAADEFARLAVDAKDLLAAANSREVEKSITAATNLRHRLMAASRHRASYLPEGFSSDLCVENLRKVSVTLASEGFPTSSQKMTKLLERCHQIHESLCGISGAVESQTEEAER